VTEIARRNGIAARVVFTWRRQARTVETTGAYFTPVRIEAAVRQPARSELVGVSPPFREVTIWAI